ncbi:MAG: hypothetical protein JF597_48485, partial [Streptomyces sp.]|uniref:hypothetical protein n=1 Tax=Streptomyces sp. TaxID=1931 RepID=UPI0025F2C8FD
MSYFPNAPLPVRVFIAPGYDPNSPTSWTWTEITSDVRFRTGISLDVGRRDEGSHADPGKCTLTLNNRAGAYSSRNALGTYYPNLRRNTPLQVRVNRMADTFTRSSGSGWGTSDAGFVWSHTATSSWTVSGTQGVTTFAAANTAAVAVSSTGGGLDVDVEYVASIGARTTGANWFAGAMLRYSDVNNMYLAGIEFDTSNTIKVSIHKWVAGAYSAIATLTATGIAYSAGTKIRVRAVAHGANLQVKAWLDGTAEPSDWNLETQDSDLSGAGVGVYQWRIAGNTNAGSLAVSIDEYTASAILFTGLVSEWPVTWDKTGNDSTATVVANGPLRRLQQAAALNSPLYRQLIAQNPAGYWPGEDGSDATSMSSAVAAERRATVVDVTFGAESDLPGSDPVLKVNSANSTITGNIYTYTITPDGYAGMFLVKLPSVPAAATTLIEWRANGTVNRWVIDADATSYGITGYAIDGTVVVARSATITVVNVTQWVAMQLETAEDGLGNVTWTLIWHQVGDTSFWFSTGSYVGTADRIAQFKVVNPMADAAYGHIWLGDNDLPFVADSFSAASAGYAGETAAARIERLCDEQNVAVLVEPASSSEALDVQRSEPFVTLLRAVEDADL